MVGTCKKTKNFARRHLCIFISVFALLLFIASAFPGCKQRPEKTEKEPVKKAKEDFTISTNPRDGQDLLNLERPIYVYFSREVKPDNFSFTITPDPGGWRVSWTREGRVAVLEHANPFQAGSRYNLELSVKPGRHKKVIRFTAYGPSSLALIEEDENEGRLDLDTAWTYRLQSLFEPDRLPPKYQSPTPIRCGTTVMRDFSTVQQQLQPSTIEKLKPYLVRPTHPESFFSRQMAEKNAAGPKKSRGLIATAFAQPQERPTDEFPEWWAKYSFAYPIKVWSPISMKKAEDVLGIIEDKAMYYNFHELLGREPLSDENDKPDNGGDGRLDIYLLPNIGFGGECVPIDWFGPGQQPAWIMIKHDLSGDALVSALAHELFHAFQYAFDSLEEHWWMESTATWAEDYIDDDMDTEQVHLEWVFLKPLHRQETLTMEDDAHEYGIYLFPYYLSCKFGDRKVAEIWHACETKDALEAVDGCVPDGLDKCFKEFALLNSDIGKYEGYYVDAKGPLELYPLHGEEKKDWKLSTDPQEQKIPIIEKTIDLPPLSAKYIRFRNKCKAEVAPHILFDLKDFYKDDRLTIQAIIDPDKEAKDAEDWSDLEEREFCINDEEEKFESIALVIASTARESTIHPKLKIRADAEGCDECYGTITYSRHDIHENRSRKQERKTEITVSVTFETPIPPGPLVSSDMAYWLHMYPLKSVTNCSSNSFDIYVDKEKPENNKTKRALRCTVRPFPEVPHKRLPSGRKFKPWGALTLLVEGKTGKVKAATTIPEVRVRLFWDDGSTSNATVGFHALKETTIGGITVKDDELVKSGDGLRHFGGTATREYKKSGDDSEYSNTTYKWEIHRRKIPQRP